MNTYHIIGKGIPHNTKVKGDGVVIHNGRITSVFMYTDSAPSSPLGKCPTRTVAFVPKHAVVLILEEENGKKPNWVDRHVKNW